MKSIKSYQDAIEYLGNKQERPYAHNTRIKAEGHETVTVFYHGNPVVTFFPDRITFNSCGWRSMTTKERINWFLPDGFYLYQQKSVWYLSKSNGGTYVFADGICIMNGDVYNYGDDSQEQETKQKVRQIKAYVDGYVKALLNHEMDKPSGGDCWICLMVDENGKSAFHGHDHIESHMEESYYVPSLLVRAYEHNKRLCDFARDGVARLWEKMEVSDWQKSIVERDVKSCLTSYIKHELGIPGK